jgi:hypothetical protein
LFLDRGIIVQNKISILTDRRHLKDFSIVRWHLVNLSRNRRRRKWGALAAPATSAITDPSPFMLKGTQGPSMPDHPLHELAGRWQSDVVLERDLFSTLERGRFKTQSGEVEAVLRRIDAVP